MIGKGLAALLALALFACAARGADEEGDPSRGPDGKADSSSKSPTDSSGACAGICNASSPSIPKLGDSSGSGDVTTYGDVANPRPSEGGACNYGATGITAYAAIQVSRLPGDLEGQWRGGRVCGQCAEVRARTPSGWKSTVVRIVDKCPDAYCGIDLGGEPARALMDANPGRYSGEWRFVPCDGHAGVSDGQPALSVKEGSNPYWALIQVRDPAERILGIRMRRAGSAGAWTDLEWATEAENFFRVPPSILADSLEYNLEAALPHGTPYLLRCRGADLAEGRRSFVLARSP